MLSAVQEPPVQQTLTGPGGTAYWVHSDTFYYIQPSWVGREPGLYP